MLKPEQKILTEHLQDSIEYARTSGDDFGSIVLAISDGLRKYDEYL